MKKLIRISALLIAPRFDETALLIAPRFDETGRTNIAQKCSQIGVRRKCHRCERFE